MRLMQLSVASSLVCGLVLQCWCGVRRYCLSSFDLCLLSFASCFVSLPLPFLLLPQVTVLNPGSGYSSAPLISIGTHGGWRSGQGCQVEPNTHTHTNTHKSTPVPRTPTPPTGDGGAGANGCGLDEREARQRWGRYQGRQVVPAPISALSPPTLARQTWGRYQGRQVVASSVELQA